ncbi:MAG: UvrB/UvrC motif-containing protein, partial [Candidatus Heimdallarchaeota archaeon]|nr:UvrB/UvrC motif-containing protein [Candidatus Heimdallarchaeota archaeon]MCK5049507.1 UvrB/UvrC motif-containing protein [Candidatus Heimdallarchaeota archaeon]
ERVIVTTLTKRMAEDLTDYLAGLDIRVRYLHSDIDTLERVLILRDLRRGDFDVIVGINLLREGLDLPEVALVAVLDADKEGFLRSQKSLTQVIGRASRNVKGRVIMYADRETDSIKATIQENNRRRLIQQRYNREHKIVPKTIQKEVKSMIELLVDAEIDFSKIDKEKAAMMSNEEVEDVILELQVQMNEAASRLEFELAAKFRDMIRELEEQFR